MATFNGWQIVIMPSFPAPAGIAWSKVSAVGIRVSGYTGQQQVYDWQNSWMKASLSMPPMRPALAMQWIGFLSACQGVANVFQFGDPLALAPRGTGSGTPVVDGAGQNGTTLATRGWTPSSAVLLAGDWLQIGYRLYRTVLDVTADAGGRAVLNLATGVKDAPLDGTAITLNSTKGLWRLDSNNPQWSIGGQRMYDIHFDIVEAV